MRKLREEKEVKVEKVITVKRDQKIKVLFENFLTLKAGLYFPPERLAIQQEFEFRKPHRRSSDGFLGVKIPLKRDIHDFQLFDLASPVNSPQKQKQHKAQANTNKPNLEDEDSSPKKKKGRERVLSMFYDKYVFLEDNENEREQIQKRNEDLESSFNLSRSGMMPSPTPTIRGSASAWDKLKNSKNELLSVLSSSRPSSRSEMH